MIDQEKQGICIDLSFRYLVCVSVCLPDNTGHTPIPIFMKFGIDVIGTKAERHVCGIFFPPVPKWRPFVGIFCRNGQRPQPILIKFGTNWLGRKAKRLSETFFKIIPPVENGGRFLFFSITVDFHGICELRRESWTEIFFH